MRIQIALAGAMPSGNMVSVSARDPRAVSEKIKFLTAKIEKMKAKPQTEVRKARINETVKRIASLQADLKVSVAGIEKKIKSVETRMASTVAKIKLMLRKPSTPARKQRIIDAEKRLEDFKLHLAALKQSAGMGAAAAGPAKAAPAPAAPTKPKKEVAPAKPAKEAAPAKPVNKEMAEMLEFQRKQKEALENRTPHQKNVDRALSFRYDFNDLHDKFSAEELSGMRDELDDRIEALQDKGSLNFSDKQRLDNMRRQWQEVDQVMRVKRRKYMEELDPMYSDDEEWDRHNEYED